MKNIHPLVRPLLLFGACLSFSIAQAQAQTQTQAQTPLLQIPPAVDAPGALWTPAAPGNFAPANRPVDEPIDLVVLHDIEGSAAAGIGIFAREGAKVSAHYIVGEDGQVYQLVREHDVAYHAGNSPINHRAVGIEMAGFAYRPGFYNSIELEAVAKLVRDVTARHAIPRDRAHIIGHAEVPNPRDPIRFGGISGHTDPGPYWNWNAFMTQLRHDSHLQSAQIPLTIRPGETVRAVATFENSGDETWPANGAADPKTGLQASGPVVYLGTFDGKNSRFADLNTWISPTLAAGTAGDIAPGQTARIEFSLRGPLHLGEIRETLRLSTQPTAAQNAPATYFGDALPLTLRVVPWDIEVAPTAAGYRAELPIGGWWAVYAITDAKKPLRFTLNGGAGETRVRVEGVRVEGVRVEGGRVEARAGASWQFAGYCQVAAGAGKPTLNAVSDGAPRGAIRLVGPFESAPLVKGP